MLYVVNHSVRMIFKLSLLFQNCLTCFKTYVRNFQRSSRRLVDATEIFTHAFKKRIANFQRSSFSGILH